MATFMCKPELKWKRNELYCGDIRLATLERNDDDGYNSSESELFRVARESDLDDCYDDEYTSDFNNLLDGKGFPLDRCKVLLERFYTRTLNIVPARILTESHETLLPCFRYEWREEYLEVGTFEYPDRLGDLWCGGMFLGEIRFYPQLSQFVFSAHAFYNLVCAYSKSPANYEGGVLSLPYPITHPREVIERIYDKVFRKMHFTLTYA